MDLEEKGFSSSRAALCAGYVFLYKNHLLNEAGKELNINRIELFRFYYDYALGFGSLAGGIDEAANKEHSVTDEAIAGYIVQKPDMFGTQSSTSQDTEEYLDIKSDVVRNAELLKRDQTGFLLADEIIRKLGTGEDFKNSNVSVEYVVAGADYARDLYKQFYEIAGSLYP